MSAGTRGHEPRKGQRQTARAGESQGIGLTEGDLQCPICMSILADPFVTACGHSFCHACLSKHLAQRKTCPSCSIFLTLDRCFPNFALQQVIAKAEVVQLGRKQNPADALRVWLETEQAKLPMEDLDALLALLTERKGQAEQHATARNMKLLLTFLQHSRKRKSRRLRELQNEIGWLDADLDAATAAPADGIFPGLLEQHDVPTPSISAWPPANGFHPIPPPHGHPLPRTHAHPHGASHHASPLQDGVLPTPQNPMDAPNGHALSQGLAPTGSSGALWNSQEHQPGGGNPFLRQGLQASPFAAAHAGSLGAEEGPRARSGSPRGVLPNVEALPQGLSLATELSLPEGLPLSAYPVPAGPAQGSLAAAPSQSPPPDVGESGHGQPPAASAVAAARAASPAGAAMAAPAGAASPAGSAKSGDARAPSPGRPSRMRSQPCVPGNDVLMGPPPRVQPLPGQRLQSGLAPHRQGSADRIPNGVVPRAGSSARSRDAAGLALPGGEDMAASVRSKKRRVTAHLGDLQDTYIRMREQAGSAPRAPHHAQSHRQYSASMPMPHAAPAVANPATHVALHRMNVPHTHAAPLLSPPALQQAAGPLLGSHRALSDGLPGPDPQLGNAPSRSHSHYPTICDGPSSAVMSQDVTTTSHGPHTRQQETGHRSDPSQHPPAPSHLGNHHLPHATALQPENDDPPGMIHSHHAASLAGNDMPGHAAHQGMAGAQVSHHQHVAHQQGSSGEQAAGSSRSPQHHHHSAGMSQQHSRSHAHPVGLLEEDTRRGHTQSRSAALDEQRTHQQHPARLSERHSHGHLMLNTHSHGHEHPAGLAEQPHGHTYGHEGPAEAAEQPHGHSHSQQQPPGLEQPDHGRQRHESGSASHSHHIHHHHYHDSSDPGSAVGPVMENLGLAEFSRVLATFIRSNKLETMAQLLQPASRQQSAAILSSIEFDAENKLFATAGVSKQISFYDFPSILAEPAATSQDPILELTSRWKLSCIAWNQMSRASLLSADYEGCVALWDVGKGQGQSVVEFDAHERRIWSAAFCPLKATQFVSGSDDGWVKVWSSEQQKSLAEIDVRANVCTVQWNPITSHELAVGSANHAVHLYDLRRPNEPTFVFKAHHKAVSYVRYLNSTELVSASTDSTLRLLDTRRQTALRTYSGHSNEKNFVGLSSSGDFMACGSETNEVYVYNKNLAKPVAKKCFSHPASLGPHDFPPFISSVCWKPHASLLLAANSEGTIKIFKLTS